MDRSAYSDIVFIEALYRNQLISRNVHRALHDARDNTLIELLQPHLVIYLDVPVDTVQVCLDFFFTNFQFSWFSVHFDFGILQQRIKERNQWGEANSPLFKDNKFLTTIDEVYKQEFLQDIAKHAEILVYDWSNGGEVELVVEDIERIGK